MLFVKILFVFIDLLCFSVGRPRSLTKPSTSSMANQSGAEEDSEEEVMRMYEEMIERVKQSLF